MAISNNLQLSGPLLWSSLLSLSPKNMDLIPTHSRCQTLVPNHFSGCVEQLVGRVCVSNDKTFDLNTWHGGST